MYRKSHGVALALIWLLASAAGVVLALSIPLFPSPASEEARRIDGAMALLAALAVPVFVLVVGVLGYSVLRFRTRGEPTEDGPPIRGNLRLEVGWLVVTAGLTLFLIGYGTTELLALRSHAAHPQGELVVRVNGSQWFWEFNYPEQRIRTRDELWLPVGRPVRFEVTASDVVHSFWVPAFRTKIDAVPGMVTIVYATPDRTGTFQHDHNFRAQCAELCGLGHAAMAAPVVVVEQPEFEAWVAQRAGGR